MSAQTEFDGETLIVLPKDYLQSAQAASEVYEEELAARVSSLEVDNLNSRPGFFRGALLATLLWMIPSIWTVCL
ncbi:MAG: hypothetical protein PVF63_01480 [Gammaproteobacteria bacterium]|jgi:hypothetical protein